MLAMHGWVTSKIFPGLYWASAWIDFSAWRNDIIEIMNYTKLLMLFLFWVRCLVFLSLELHYMVIGECVFTSIELQELPFSFIGFICVELYELSTYSWFSAGHICGSVPMNFGLCGIVWTIQLFPIFWWLCVVIRTFGWIKWACVCYLAFIWPNFKKKLFSFVELFFLTYFS